MSCSPPRECPQCCERASRVERQECLPERSWSHGGRSQLTRGGRGGPAASRPGLRLRGSLDASLRTAWSAIGQRTIRHAAASASRERIAPCAPTTIGEAPPHRSLQHDTCGVRSRVYKNTRAAARGVLDK
jgi:hypothetical protein